MHEHKQTYIELYIYICNLISLYEIIRYSGANNVVSSIWVKISKKKMSNRNNQYQER